MPRVRFLGGSFKGAELHAIRFHAFIPDGLLGERQKVGGQAALRSGSFVCGCYPQFRAEAA
jgi:hypothetical protein